MCETTRLHEMTARALEAENSLARVREAAQSVYSSSMTDCDKLSTLGIILDCTGRHVQCQKEQGEPAAQAQPPDMADPVVLAAMDRVVAIARKWNECYDGRFPLCALELMAQTNGRRPTFDELDRATTLLDSLCETASERRSKVLRYALDKVAEICKFTNRHESKEVTRAYQLAGTIWRNRPLSEGAAPLAKIRGTSWGTSWPTTWGTSWGTVPPQSLVSALGSTL